MREALDLAAYLGKPCPNCGERHEIDFHIREKVFICVACGEKFPQK
jgi:hypothetical protein